MAATLEPRFARLSKGARRQTGRRRGRAARRAHLARRAWTISCTAPSRSPFPRHPPSPQTADHGIPRPANPRPRLAGRLRAQALVLPPSHGRGPAAAARRAVGGRPRSSPPRSAARRACGGRRPHTPAGHAVAGALPPRRRPWRPGGRAHSLGVPVAHGPLHGRAHAGVRRAAAPRSASRRRRGADGRRLGSSAPAAAGVQRTHALERAAASGDAHGLGAVDARGVAAALRTAFG